MSEFLRRHGQELRSRSETKGFALRLMWMSYVSLSREKLLAGRDCGHRLGFSINNRENHAGVWSSLSAWAEALDKKLLLARWTALIVADTFLDINQTTHMQVRTVAFESIVL